MKIQINYTFDVHVPVEEDYPGEANEVRRHAAVDAGVKLIYAVVEEFGDGTAEEFNYLRCAIVNKLVDSITGRFASDLLAADLKKRFPPTEENVQPKA